MKKRKASKYQSTMFDPEGSYTGTRVPAEKIIDFVDLSPIQDVDDL